MQAGRITQSTVEEPCGFDVQIEAVKVLAKGDGSGGNAALLVWDVVPFFDGQDQPPNEVCVRSERVERKDLRVLRAADFERLRERMRSVSARLLVREALPEVLGLASQTTGLQTSCQNRLTAASLRMSERFPSA